MLWWFPFWSKIYRFFGQPKRRYKNVVLDKGHTPQSASEVVNMLTYHPDDWTVLNDAISRPEHVQMSIDCKREWGFQIEGPQDCDDYAIWCAHTISPEHNPQIITISMQKPNGELSGHAMCLAQDSTTKKYYHVGNWGCWGPYDTVKETLESVLNNQRAKLVGWSVFSKNLKLLRYDKKL